MRLYHTSYQIISNPDTSHSRDKLDFGKGFYLTTIREQAIRYSLRFKRRNLEAYLNIYELDDDLSTFNIKTFNHYDEEWLDFVASCRKGNNTEKYDAISGGIANDKVFNTIDLFFAGIISKEEALGKLKYIEPNHQLCISNDLLLSQHLHFISSEKL